MDQGVKITRPPCPKETANVFSLVSFFYTIRIYINGFKRDLEEEDICAVMKSLKSKKIGDKLEKAWIEDKMSNKKTSLYRALWVCYGKRFLIFGFMQLFVRVSNVIITPMVTGRLVNYFSPDSNMSAEEAYLYAGLEMAFKLFDAFFIHNYAILVAEFGFMTRSAFCSLIYRKCLRLSPASQAEYTTGKVITLMTKDVQYIDAFATEGFEMWIAVVEAVVVALNVYNRIGVVSLIGMGFILGVMPFQLYIAQRIGFMKREYCKRIDVRLHATQEALSAIKIIKMYTWEFLFADKIANARRLEIVKLRLMIYLEGALYIAGYLSAQFGLYVVLTTYSNSGVDITAENIFYTVSSYEHLKTAMSFAFPFGTIRLTELMSGVSRISELLDAEELPTPDFHTDVEGQPKVVLNDVSFSVKTNLIINNVSFTLIPGLNVITGPLGSGKSSLLKIMLQDYPVTSGSTYVQGKVSYASQEPWLFPASIKHNILFGEQMNDERYRKVLSVCALEYDLKILISGDETIVEDSGLNLSKGQQARVNLARAIYKESDIYLLDDCLAALDVNVQEHIFRQCIKEFLKGKLCVWVSHNLKSIREADQVIVLSKGAVKSARRPSEIPESELIKMLKKSVTSKEKEGKEKKSQSCFDGDKTKGSNLYREVKKVGGVDFDVYKKYFKFGGGIFALLYIVVLFINEKLAGSYKERLLSDWVDLKVNVTAMWRQEQVNPYEYVETLKAQKDTFTLYSIILGVSTLTLMCRDFSFFYYICRLSIKIHKSMVENVLGATMEFFDNTFIGNILNRFSGDLSIIDQLLPMYLFESFEATCEVISKFALIATVNATYLVPSFIIFLILVLLRWFYMPTGRSLKRLDSSTRSPVIGHINASLMGTTTIRACGRQDRVIEEFDRHQDLYISATHMSMITRQAFAFFLNLLAYFYTGFIVVDLLFFSPAQAGSAGLALSKAFELSSTLQWVLKRWSNLENTLTSVERVLEYTDVKHENREGEEIENWPKNGSLKYDTVSLSYEKTNETVLKDITFEVLPKEKVGIVGRTGAGKSSIISSLFRLYEITGKITIDGIDCSKVALNRLRSRVSIIPQEPVLFRGTIRDNIDPASRFTDEEIWTVLETVKLKELIHDLSWEIIDGDTEFSSGQRQLFCLARALINKNKIIILDEATANMDPEADILINGIIKKEFESCTVITIAHKLSAIINSDKIIVLDKGRLVECDSPNNLLNDESSIFYKMMQSDE